MMRMGIGREMRKEGQNTELGYVAINCVENPDDAHFIVLLHLEQL